MVLVSFGKYKGRPINEMMRDRRYVDWVMTNMEMSFSPLAKLIHSTIETQKTALKTTFADRKSPEFICGWLEASYEGYKVRDEDIMWVQELLKTDKADIFVTFHENGYMFNVDSKPVPILALNPSGIILINQALRHEILDQVSYFRKKQFHNRHTWICEETGKDLTNTPETHVDHHFRKKTFLQLVQEFFPDRFSIPIEFTGTYYRLKDRTQAKEWADYHQSNAILRLIHVSANTNPEYYLQTYPDPPYAPKPKPKQEKPSTPTPRFTFDSFLARESTP